MPSHKIHMAIAQIVNKELKLNNDKITLGSVLPDLTIMKNHGLSHFQYIDEYPYNLASADEFVKKYNMFDDISIGYIIHLLTDKYYNYRYYNDFYDFKDNKPYKLKEEYSYIDNIKKFKHDLFESYDIYLLKNVLIEKINDISIINFIPNYDDIKFDKDYLSEYILKSNDEIDYYRNNLDLNYEIDNQYYLDELFNGCIKYVEKYLVNILKRRNNYDVTRINK